MVKKVLVFLATMLLINSTYANPVGGVVTAGSASITSPSANTVQVTQTTDKAIVNWQSFNISSDETTRFVQPNSNSIALNRINPQQGASQIYGQLQANGKIILVNQAGIFFGPNSVVNVAGIIASATDITDANFLAGKYVFDQKSPYYNGSIINQGTIIAANNGLVALVGSAVSNEGMIQAHLGNVILASGNKFTVGFDDTGLINFTVDEASSSAGLDQNGNTLKHGVNNSGTIIADGGTILMSAKSAQGVLDHVINMTGVAQARSVHEKNGEIILAGDDEGMTYVSGTLDASGINVGETGGVVQVLGKYIFVDNPAVINASGDIGGGQIYIGGNEHGQGPLPNATTTFVAQGVNLLADAITQGNGGKVIAWADLATGFEGQISARGGANGGDGGFAETSGKMYLGVGDNVFVNLNSPLGETGTWLLDPTAITISTAANSNITFSAGNYTPTSGVTTTSNINVTTLNTNLGGANNVVISTASGAAGTGTITLNAGAAISWSSARTLTLNSQSDITIGSTITSTNTTAGNGSLTLNTGATGGNIIVNSAISTSGGNILLTAPTAGSITLSAALSSVLGTVNLNAPFGSVTLNSTVTTTGGAAATVTSTSSLNMFLNAGSGVTTSGAAQTYNASTVNLGSGATIGLNAGAGNITFSGSIDGAANLTLTSNGIIDLVGGHIGGSTPLTTFTTNGTGTLKSSGNTLFSPHVATTGNQVYNTAIAAGTATPSVFLIASGAGSTIRLNNSVTNTGADVQLRAPGGVILGCSTCGVNPTINAGTITISNAIATPVTLLNATVLTTNTTSGTNTFSGAISGAFALTLNEAASAITNFASTVNIASLTTTGATSSIAFNGGNVTTSGAQVYGNAVTIGTPLTMSASAITLANVANSLSAGANNLTISANAMTFNGAAGSVTGTGSLALTPSTANATIGLVNAGSTLNITAADIAALGTGFSGISIGATGATGIMTVGAAANFGSNILTLNAGSYTDTGANVVTAGTLNVKANSAAGAIGAAGANALGISATNLSFTTSNGNAFFTSAGGTNISSASTVGTAGLTFTSMGGSVTQSAGATVTASGLTATLTGTSSALNLNNASNAITTLNAITAPGGFNLTNGNNATADSGTINTSGGNGNISINTGTATYTQNNIDMNSGNGTITIISDGINIASNTGGNAFQTQSVLTLKPSSAATNMSLAGAAAYDLSQTEITSFTSGLGPGAYVEIGNSAASTGSLTTGGAVSFGTFTVNLFAGSFANASATNIITAGSLNLTARNAGGAIGASGAANAIRVATLLSAINLSTNTSNGNAFVASAGNVNMITSSLGTGTLTLTSIGGNVTQGGIITAGSLSGTVSGSLNLGTQSNVISTLGAITATNGFSLTNGNNPITTAGAITTTNSAVSINTGTGTYSQNDFDISSGSGPITITAGSLNIATNTGSNAFITSGALTLKPSNSASNMSLAGAAAFDITASEATSLSGGVTGTINIGDSAASTGTLNVGGAVSFGAKTVNLNAGSFTDTTSSVITAGTLNLVARNAGGTIGAQGASNAIAVTTTNLSLTSSNGSAFISSPSGGFNFSTASNIGTGSLVLTNVAGTVSQSAAGTITAGELIASLSAGALNLNGATFNSIGTLGNYLIGNITAPGGFNLTTGNLPVSSGGVGGVTITTTNSPVNINTGTSSFTSTGTTVNAGSGNITITADTLNLGNGASQLHTTGTLTLKPFTASSAISLAGSAAFNLTYDDMVQLSNGLTSASNIVIGDSAAGTGTLTIVGAAQLSVFSTPTVSLYGGSIAAATNSVIQAGTLNLIARSAGGTIGSAVNPVTIDTSNNSTNLSVTTSNASAFLNLYNAADFGHSHTFSGASSLGSGTLNLTSTGAKTTVNQSATGAITANTLTAIFSDPSSSLSLNGASNAITNLSTVTVPGGFSLTNGNNALAVIGNVSTTDSDVSISTGTGGYTQNNPNTISTGIGNITITADTVAIGTASNAFSTQGVLTLQPTSAATTMSLAGASTFDLSTAEIAALIGGVTGSGSIVIGNAANSTAVFTIGAASNFTGKTLTLNGGSFTDTGASVITASTLNLLARTGAIGASGANAVGISAGNLSLNTTNANAFITSASGTNFSGTSTLGSGTLTMTMGGTVSQSASSPITANSLVATLSGASSALNLNNSSNAFTNLGAITAPGGFNLTNGNTSTTVTGAINTSTGNGAVSISTGTGTYNQNDVDINSGNGAITIISDAINLTTNTGGNALQTQTVLTLKPFSASTNMSLAGAAPYDLTQSEISSFIGGLGSGAYAEIGNSAASTGTLTTGGPVSFSTFTVNLFAGSFANASASNIITAGSLNLTARNSGGAIGASGAANAIRVASALSAINLTTNTNNGNAFIASAGNITMGLSSLGTGNLTFTSVGGNINQNGVITAGGLAATLTSGTINLNTSSNNISNLNGITAPGGFNLTNGNNPTTVAGAINTSGSNGAVNINTGTGAYSQNDFDISSGSGAITIIGDAMNIGANTGNNAFITTGALTLKPSSAGTAMSLAGSSAFDLTAAEITALTGGVTGAGTVTIGDGNVSTATMTIGGAVNFGTPSVTLSAGTFADPAGSVITANNLTLNPRISGIGTSSNPVAILVNNLRLTQGNNASAYLTSTNSVNFGGGATNIGLGGITVSTSGAITQTSSITAGGFFATTSSGVNLSNTSNSIWEFSANNSTSGNIQLVSQGVGYFIIDNVTQAGSGAINLSLNGATPFRVRGPVSTTGTGDINLTSSASAINLGENFFNNSITSTSGNITVDAGANTISLNSSASPLAATTGGNINFNSPVSLAQGATLNASTGNINFNNTVSGAFALAATTSGAGATTFSNTVSGLASLTVSGTANINTTGITTTGAQTYNNAVSLGAAGPITLTSSNGGITFGGTVNGAKALSIANSSGTVTFGGIVGGSNALTSLTIGTGNTAAINTTGITTSGAQTYNGAITLGAGSVTTLTSTGGSGINFGNTIDGSQGLSIANGSGAITFNSGATVGATTALASLLIGTGNNTAINSTSIRTSGSQTYNSAITLGAGSATTLTSTGGSGITFNNTIDGSQGLSIGNSSGAITFNSGATVGGTTALASLLIGTGNNTAINSTSIRTSGSQTYNGAITLGAASLTTLTSTGGSGITFGNTVNGPQALSIANNSGAISFNSGAIVGGTSALTSLLIGTGNNTAINSTGITTSGSQTYNSAITLGASSVTTLASTGGSGITFSNTVDGSQGLSIANSSGAITFNSSAIIGGGSALASLLIGTGNNTAINSTDITTSGAQTYNSAVTLGAGSATTLRSTGASGITFGNTVNGPQALSIANNSGAITFNNNIGNTSNLSSLLIGTGNPTAFNMPSIGVIGTSGSQTYNSAVTMNSGSFNLFASNGSGITFNSTLDGSRAFLTTSNTGLITFNGVVGGTTPLINIQIVDGDPVAINTTGITTTGSQNYGSAVTLGAGSLTTLSGSGTFTFSSTLDGPQGLSIADGHSTVNFNGAVGSTSLASLLVGTGGTVNINTGNITTTGSQTYNSSVNIGGSSLTLATTNSAVNFGSSITNTLASDLTINTGNAAISLTGSVGLSGALGALTLNSTGTTTIGNSVNAASITTNAGGNTVINGTSLTTTGAQTYNDAVSFGGVSPTRTLSADTIILASTLDAAAANLRLFADTAITFSGGVGSVTGTGTLQLAPITTTKTIGVNGAVGDLSLSATDFAALGNGFSLLTIGQAGQSGLITIPTVSFSVPTTISSASISASGNISTAGASDLTLNGPVALSGATTFSSGTGNINFQNTITGGGNTLATSTSGAGVTTFSNILSGLATLTTTGTTAINGGSVTTSGAQNYNDAITLGADSTFNTTDSLVNFASTVDSAATHALTVNAGTGAITLGNNIGSVNALGAINLNSTGITTVTGTINADSITTDAGGTTAINGGSITTTNAQNYNDAVTLGADSAFTTSNSLVNFGSTITNVTSRALTVDAGFGAITLSGNIGTGTALGAILLNSTNTTTLSGTVNAASLTTDAGGTTALNGGNVTTSGAQNYNDDVTLGADTTLNTTNSLVNFASNMDSTAGNALTVNAGSGAITLGTVGSINALGAIALNSTDVTTLNGTINAASIITNAGGTTALNGGNVTTSGAQTYNDDMTLGAGTVLQGANITLSGVTGGTQSLTLSDSGTSILNGALTGLTTLQTNAVTFNNGNVTSTGSQTYNGIATLGASAVLTSDASDITFNNTLIGGAQSLTLTGGAGGDHIFTLNDISSLNTLTINGNASVSNTLAFLASTGTNVWNITGANIGTLTATNITSAGFNNIQTLNSGNAINDFVFNDGATLSGSIQAGGSASDNTLDISAYSTPITIDVFAGTATSGLTSITSFGNIHHLIGTDAGSTANSTLLQLGNTTIASKNTGSTNSGFTFNGFGNLGGNNDDTTFTFSANASITGNLTDTLGSNSYIFSDGSSIGGNLTGSGHDTLSVAGFTTPVTVNLSGSSPLVNGTITGINSFAGTDAGSGANSTLQGPTGNNDWTFYANSTNSGTIGGTLFFSDFGNIKDGSNNNSFIFQDNANISGSLTGGGADTLDYSAYTSPVSVNAAGTSTTGIGGTFSGISTVTGNIANSNSNTYTNVAGGKNWSISDNNIGSVAGITFNNFGTLVGGSADTFALGNGKSINSISATNGTLDYSAYTTAVAIDTTNPVNTATNVSSLTGISTFTGSVANSNSNTFTNTSGSKTWSITNNNIGSINGQNFNNFGTLVGGSADTFALSNGKSISSISATNGTLDYSAYSTAVAINTTNPAMTATNVGSLTGITNLIGGSGSNTFTNTTGSNTWNISNNNVGSVLGKNFTAFGNLTGGTSDIFVFANSSAAITGNIVGGTGSTLDVSALSSPTIDIQHHTSTNVGGTFSGISTFIGSGTTSTLVGPDNSTWHINSLDGGTVNGNTFTAFGNLVDGSGTNDFILESGGTIDGSITGGGTNNTLTVATGNTQWIINGANAGSVTGITGGFTNIQNLVGSTDTNTFTFTGNSTITGTINGGNTTNTNVIDYSGYANPVTLTLSIPTSGNQFNSGSINNQTNIASFTQIQSIVGPSTGTNILYLPANKSNISVTYTNAAKTSGYIGDPFFFTNFIIQNAPVPPAPAPVPNGVTVPDVAQIVTPFTDINTTPPSSVLASTQSLNFVVDQNINQILDQQLSLDVELAHSLTVGCFQTQ